MFILSRRLRFEATSWVSPSSSVPPRDDAAKITEVTNLVDALVPNYGFPSFDDKIVLKHGRFSVKRLCSEPWRRANVSSARSILPRVLPRVEALVSYLSDEPGHSLTIAKARASVFSREEEGTWIRLRKE